MMTVARNLVLGAVLGLGLGVALALVRDWNNDRLVREGQVIRATDTGVLAWIPESARAQADAPHAETSPAGEAYRALCAAVQAKTGTRTDGTPTVVVVAPVDGEADRGFTGLDLATTFARGGHRTTLVTARARASLAGIDSVRGLSVLRRDPVGSRGERETLAPGDLRTSLDGLADVVVVDVPPLPTHADGVAAGADADGVVLVARWQASSRAALGRSVDLLGHVGAQLLGVALFDVPAWPVETASRSPRVRTPDEAEQATSPSPPAAATDPAAPATDRA